MKLKELNRDLYTALKELVKSTCVLCPRSTRMGFTNMGFTNDFVTEEHMLLPSLPKQHFYFAPPSPDELLVCARFPTTLCASKEKQINRIEKTYGKSPNQKATVYRNQTIN